MAGLSCFRVVKTLTVVLLGLYLLSNPGLQSSATHRHSDHDHGKDNANLNGADNTAGYSRELAEEIVIAMKVPHHAEPEDRLSQAGGFRVELLHRDSPNSPSSAAATSGGNVKTKAERLREAVERSNGRQRGIRDSIAAKAQGKDIKRGHVPKDIEARVHAGSGEFLMLIAIGSPPLTYNAIVDTGSDLIWTQCRPCTDCYRQTGPIYDPSRSSSYTKISCSSTLCEALPYHSCGSAGSSCQYEYEYGDLSFTTGNLAYEAFTFSGGTSKEQKIPAIAFGCGHENRGGGFLQGGGLVGMGRGPLSLISQLGSAVHNKFSYCLQSIDDPPNKTSPLLFGDAADLHGAVKSTPLVRNAVNPTFYYLKLDGISVAGSPVNIPRGTFDIGSDGSGGFIIDSGTTITYLYEAAYHPLKQAVQSHIKLQEADGSALGLNLCYKLPSDRSTGLEVPSLTFHFAGGADYEMPAENYFVAVEESGLLCLAMAGSSGISIFGNVQQQNFHILYDVGEDRLSFVPATCDAL